MRKIHMQSGERHDSNQRLESSLFASMVPMAVSEEIIFMDNSDVPAAQNMLYPHLLL